MAGAREVASFAVKYVNDRAAFLAEVTSPVLVWESAPLKPEAPLLFSTRAGQKPKQPAPGRPVFFAVSKSAKNAFNDEVTVGRAPNNDVCIEDNSVSRFHAYLAPESGRDAWAVVDVASTAGTSVDGQALKPKTPSPVGDGMKLCFGDVELRYLVPASFWSYVQQLIGKKK